ncbi:hypothetical protein Bca4012_054477 [Brassica carinata]
MEVVEARLVSPVKSMESMHIESRLANEGCQPRRTSWLRRSIQRASSMICTLQRFHVVAVRMVTTGGESLRYTFSEQAPEKVTTDARGLKRSEKLVDGEMEAPSKITEIITTKKTSIIVESRLMKRKETITIDEEEDEEKIQEQERPEGDVGEDIRGHVPPSRGGSSKCDNMWHNI